MGRADYRELFVYCIVPMVANVSDSSVGIVSGCDSDGNPAQCCFRSFIMCDCSTLSLRSLMWLMVKSAVVWGSVCFVVLFFCLVR